MNNSDMPAMPLSLELSERYEQGFYDQAALGLTKREHFAGLAMQGLITLKGKHCCDTDVVAAQCVRMADSLLAELDKSK
jgi:hypothetical protein